MTAAAPDAVVAVPAPRDAVDDAVAAAAGAVPPAQAVASGTAAAPSGVTAPSPQDAVARGRLARLVPRRRTSEAPAVDDVPARRRRLLPRRGAVVGAGPLVPMAGPAAPADAPARLRRLLPRRRAVVEQGTGSATAAGVVVLTDVAAGPGLAVRLSGPAVLVGAALVGAGLSASLPALSAPGPLLVPAGLVLARVALTVRAGRPLLSAVLSKAGVLVLLLAVGAFVGSSSLPPTPAAPASTSHVDPAHVDPAPSAPALPAAGGPAGQADTLQQQLQDLQRRLASIEAPPS